MNLRLRFMVLPLATLPGVLRAQAMVEYGLKAAGSVMGASGGSGGSAVAVAGCKVDSALLSCIGHAYPRTAVVAAVVICLLIVRWLALNAGYRAR
jgi:hypothetical protein